MPNRLRREHYRERIRRPQHYAHRAFDALARELGDQPYFVGGAMSLADVLLAPQLDFFAATPEWPTLTVKNANLVAWLRRMSARPSLAATTWEQVSAMALAS
jgi:glutathione S-transferase